ncbi:hypothetical protein ISF_00203 [Cordyceps fumosorosea ARSEF 2679]|uniref:Uncharacterized protein n=1 Tax=Cordyceps fumosorosea (strain ARSEF 2679) TaxID=1081104 RepID=A0A162JSW9_CORFA|nr:hypothetical protein ISF_00203 [Cordyceps fumosorosea ARSEF 2679]OAA73302.1 hypothetical protein ISF_00203 [Cordyceps fumosorosea ARSEF 2679]
MSKRAVVPDAWDDDWETQADRAAKEEAANPTPAPVLTKAERLEEHVKSNRKLWEAAESNETFHYVEATNTVPLAATFKPQVKLLSRKPVIARRGEPSRLADDDDGPKKEVQLTAEEVRAKQKRERDEKQRKYDEARAKIFGDSANSSRGSSPGNNGTTTPPRLDARSQQGRGGGRGRGGRGSDSTRSPFESRRTALPSQATPGKLYDPNYSPKPDAGFRKRDEAGGCGNGGTGLQIRDEGVPLREPRGPDGTGRGGFGFARRGAKEA